MACVDADNDFHDDVTGYLCTNYPTKVTHTFPSPGSYFVKLRIGDTCGGASEMTRDLEVANRAPVPSFTVGSCQGLTCSFDARATTDDWGLATQRWNFGDDTPFVTGPLVEHTFPRLGTYSVQLLAEDIDGLSDVTTRTVELVDQPPVAAFRWVCIDLTCQLTGESTDDWGLAEERWRWRRVGTAGTTTFAVGRTAVFTAPIPGTYELILRATDSASQFVEVRQQIDILGVLTAASDNVVLPANSNSVSFQPLGNDRSPLGVVSLVDVSPPAHGTVSIAGSTVTYTATGLARAEETDTFAYRITDSTGQQASGLIRVVARPIAQVGRITDLSTTPRRVEFQSAFAEPPVVFATPVLALWKDPVIARVTAVDTTGFTVYIQEPPGTSDAGAHGATTVHWLAVAPTLRTLANGTIEGSFGVLEGVVPYAAGKLELGSADQLWGRLTTPEELAAPGLGSLVVFAQTQTVRDPGWVITRLDEVRPEGFSVAVQPYQARTSDHATETVGWFAVAASVLSSGQGGVLFEAGASPAMFDSSWRAAEFAQSYPRTPVFLAGLLGSLDLDPAVLRYRNLKDATVEVRIEEEQTFDLDTSHRTEPLATFVVEEPLVLSGRSTPPEATPGGSVALEAAVESTRRGPRYVEAVDDVAFYRGRVLQQINIPVLRNDRGKRSTLQIAWVNPPVYGLAWLDAPGIVRYQPPRDFCGEDFFTYILIDDEGHRSYAAVRVKRERPRGNGGPPDLCGAETTGGAR